METYKNLMDACKILKDARESEAASYTPAWVMLYHADQYLTAQATAAMRGE